MRLITALLLVALGALTHAKVYEKCELAKELKCTHGLPSSQLADWVCLVAAESSYNTAALNSGTNPDNSKDYGLFQINDRYWCGTSTAGKDCGIECSKLIDSNIADDVKCAKKVYARHGFDGAWAGWRSKCKGKNLSSYTSGCNLTC